MVKPDNPGKPDKPKKCNVKVQLAIDGTVVGTDYEVTLGDQTLTKTAEEEITVFMFNFGKAQKPPKAFLLNEVTAKPVTGNCPPKGSTLTGTINDGEQSIPISATIVSDKKPTKVAITLPEPEPEPPIDPEPEPTV